jgi:hypothetical protein
MPAGTGTGPNGVGIGTSVQKPRPLLEMTAPTSGVQIVTGSLRQALTLPSRLNVLASASPNALRPPSIEK